MKTALTLAVLLITAATATAQTTQAPEQVRLASGLYPDRAQLGRDAFACARSAGLETVEQIEAMATSKPVNNQQTIRKLRTVADWIECMNARGYIVPSME